MVIWGFSVVYILMCVLCVSGFQYKCHRDICDASWQFCNDGEERCNTCTAEQCETDVAEHIFNQCETLCKTLQKTSTEKATTAESITTAVPHQVQAQVSSMIMILILTGVILVVVLLTFMGCIGFRYLRQIRRQQQIDVEKGSSIVTYSTLQSSGEPEKVPLLDSAVQATDSGLHENKMEDARILADATSNLNTVDQKQPSAPPSYSTEDNRRDRSMSPVACCEDDLQSGGNHQVTLEQDRKCENLGDTNLLSTRSLSSDDSECITRPKSVTC